MKRIAALLVCFFTISLNANAADISTASSQDLLAVYKQLRTLQAGESANCENVVLKRDAATFTFISGQIVFAGPVSGRILAARFKGDGKVELEPSSTIDKLQLSHFANSPKMTDTFSEAVFYFTDDTYQELTKFLKPQAAQANDTPFESSQKQYSESYNDWIDNQRKGNPTMRNVAARMLADLTDTTSKGFFLADFKGKKSGDLLFHISYNRDPLLLPDYAKGDEVMLIHVNPGNYYEWISGFHLASEYTGTNHPDHRTLLAHCETEAIDFQIGKDNALSATADMEYTLAQGSSVRILPLNLNGVLRISSIVDGAGNKIDFIQEDKKLDSDPWIILPSPAKPGEKYKVKISYKEESTRDSRIVFQRGSGLYYVTSRESWFPSFGAFDDRTQYEITARSPKKYKFVASGSLVSSEKAKDDLVTKWKGELPLSVIGFNYGDFVEATQAAPNLSVTAYSGKELPTELKDIESKLAVLDLAGGGDSDPDIQALKSMRAGFNTAANVKHAAGISIQAFSLYEFLFGSLPFKAVSVTEQPVRGYGQSWPNLIFLPYDSLLDATTRNNLRIQNSGGEREFYSTVAVHEMAHQWWGHLVGWKTYHDQWLSEGVAEFASYLYIKQFDPKQMKNFWDLKRTWLLSKNEAGNRPVDVGPVWLSPQLNRYIGNNSQLVYYKGAYIMEMLRMLMYDPQAQNPDSKFITMLRDFTKTYAGQNVSTDDFRKTVEKHCGGTMDWFFDQWVYGTYTPNYDFSYQVADAGSGQTEVSLTLTQSGVPETFHMKLPLYVTVNGSLRFLGLISVTGTKPMKTSIKLPIRPEKVVLDPNQSILAEIHQ